VHYTGTPTQELDQADSSGAGSRPLRVPGVDYRTISHPAAGSKEEGLMHRNAPLTPEGRFRFGWHRRGAGIDRASRAGPPRHQPIAFVHIDVKKLARVPEGGGHKFHGRRTEVHRGTFRMIELSGYTLPEL
jgi:hypothetical protein